jgi:hypothetical protein
MDALHHQTARYMYYKEDGWNREPELSHTRQLHMHTNTHGWVPYNWSLVGPCAHPRTENQTLRPASSSRGARVISIGVCK